jgi:hypothetical protein
MGQTYTYPNNLYQPLTGGTIRLRTKAAEYEEFTGRVALMPGMLLAEQADGTVIPHPVAGGKAERLIAVEDALQGHTIFDTYNPGDTVLCWIGLFGDDFFMYVASGAAQINAGQGVTSDGAGGVKLAGSTDNVIGVAQIQLLSPAAQTWIPVRIS